FAGCLCGLGFQHSDESCKMSSGETSDLPLNVYVIILGVGLFIFMLSMIFCCYLFRLFQLCIWQMLHGSHVNFVVAFLCDCTCVLATYAGIAAIVLFFKLKPKKQNPAITAK
ncbi:RN122 protein, partial [Polyodon spathula]|nr:RN122 protein [Polyodon spathula]